MQLLGWLDSSIQCGTNYYSSQAMAKDFRQPAIWPAGWALRRFSPDQFASFLDLYEFPILEISKDYIREGASLKTLALFLADHRRRFSFKVSFAATTDLVNGSGFCWESYRRYLGVQVAQAHFLECSLFRVLIGKATSSVSHKEVVRRVLDLCTDLRPVTAAIEIHATLESEPAMLEALVEQTPASIVVDLENMFRAGMTLETLLSIVPMERIAYFHQRNLGKTWIEHELTAGDEERCHQLFPHSAFLWEPKTLDDPELIQQMFHEYQAIN